MKLAAIIPWDDLVKMYYETLGDGFGRPAIDARMVIGAMTIKEKKRLPDEETIEEIQENAVLQYFQNMRNSATRRLSMPHGSLRFGSGLASSRLKR